MMTIAFFTTTRAEFGIMSSFIKKIQKSNNFKGLLFVGGTHLMEEYGSTINEIKQIGLEITDTFDYIQEGNSSFDIAKSSGYCSLKVSEIFNKYDFDIISILGDRYELIPITLNALLFNKPIIHWGGGEFTEGVIDNQIRQMVSKAANIHFVVSDKYVENLIELGEKKENICKTGYAAIEGMNKIKPIDKIQLYNYLGLKSDKPVILLTYHPVTIEFNTSPLVQIKNIFEALQSYDFQVIITAPNLESNREIILDYIEEECSKNDQIHYFESLGIKRYYSLIRHCSFLIGNTSSGIFEAPYFNIPTLNIGDRQKGRFMHKSVITTNYSQESIREGINKITHKDFILEIKSMKYRFGNGNTSEIAMSFLKNTIIDENLIRKI
jgi:GDP/UDP-N,N'-diacetylbacillosamine 2-epimerase (hydrolysing)